MNINIKLPVTCNQFWIGLYITTIAILVISFVDPNQAHQCGTVGSTSLCNPHNAVMGFIGLLGLIAGTPIIYAQYIHPRFHINIKCKCKENKNEVK